MASRWSTTLDDAAPSARRRGRLRTVAGLVGLLLFVGGTQAGVAAPGEPARQARVVAVEDQGDDGDDADRTPPEHEAAIAAYWRERDAAFARGGEAGVTFVASRLHPDLDHSVESCVRAWFPDGVQQGLRQEVTLREDTIAPAPDWRMPSGPLYDTALTDPVYRMHVEATLTGLPSNVDVEQVFAVHLAVFDGRAYGFATCVEPTVARMIIDELATHPAAQTVFGEMPAPPDTSAPVPQAPMGGGAPGSPAPEGPRPAPVPPPPPPADAPPPADTPPVDHASPPPPPPGPAPPPPPPPPASPPPAVDPAVPVSPPPMPWPTLPPREWPDAPPSDADELTIDQELFIVLVLIDGLVQAGALTVADALELLTELAEAPELDDDQRALVEANLELLRDYDDDPQGDPPRLDVLVDPETGDALGADEAVEADGAMQAAEGDDSPDVSAAHTRATRAGCDVVLDVLDIYRPACD